MHEGRLMTWREVVEKHHAAFIDEMEGCVDVSIRSAVETSLLQVREEAQRGLADLKAEAEQRFTSGIDEANRIAAAALSEQLAAFEKQRLAELDKLKAEAHTAFDEVKSSFDRARDADRDETRRVAQQSLSEQWNQFFRRMRQATSPQEVLRFISEASASYAERLVVLVFENNHAAVATSRNIEPSVIVSFPSSSSPAIEAVILSRDPVVALAAESELSAPLIRMLQPAVGEKVYLFPVRGRQVVLAVVAAHGVPAPAFIELLCESAGFQLDILTSNEAIVMSSSHAKIVQAATAPYGNLPAFANQAAPLDVERPNLVTISGSLPLTAPVKGSTAATKPKNDFVKDASPARAWEELDPAEQKLHLQAQRFARVQVAEMRLYKPDAVRTGLDQKNLYHALKNEIDDSRKQFLHRFLTISPNMVDYLHLEILRNLVHDDDHLLGREYPGPMV